ncbi:MAG: diacylglycerol kinase family protein [Clostridia bacterium]|nr:diacylglycerol kinase family protein [Clostridia bacterium]
MKKYCVLYNPNAGRGKGKEEAEKLQEVLEEIALADMTKIDNYTSFFAELGEEDEVVVCGGDGTLNRFVNEAGEAKQGRKLFYYACGSGNDFMREVGDGGKSVAIDEYIKKLPTVEVNGKTYSFINGVGYGIDGYCCEIGDKLRAETEKPINYAGIAIKGLLFHYKPTDATVLVDGKEYHFKKVWLAPTMNGRYYGGGMIPCPEQKRTDDTVSVMLFHGSGKLKSLMMFPSIFKGEHVKYKKNIAVLSGKEITVKFDEPRTLQIDGETVLNVTEYTVRK